MATIRKRGQRWQVQVRRVGSTPVSRSFLSRRDAEAWARQMEVQVDRRELPQDPRQLERVTLAELVVRYRDTITARKKGAYQEAHALNVFLRHPICNKRLSDITTSDFAIYRDQRLTEVKPITLKRQLSIVSNIFTVARNEWGLPIRENPLSRLSLKAPSIRRERRLKKGEEVRLLKAADACLNPYVRPVIEFAIATGMRRGEILALRWRDVDLQERAGRVTDAKNGHPRVVPLTSAAIAVLESLRRKESHSENIFPLTANAFRLAWERTMKRAGIEDLHFHDLRHEALSRFFEKGLNAPEVASVSGHRDMRMLFRYVHPKREHILEKLEDPRR